MTSRLSSKGQIVLPKQVRARLQLRPDARLVCEVKGGSILLTPESPTVGRSKRVVDGATGLRITRSPAGVKVSSADVKAALLDFP